METRFPDVSCMSVSECVAVGSEGPKEQLLADKGVAATWNGGRWTSELVPSITGTEEITMAGISCPPGQAVCEAVGGEANETAGIVPIVLRRSGPGEWVRQSFEAPGGTSLWSLSGIECPTSVTTCLAVGSAWYSGKSGSEPRPLVERFNGSAWHAEVLHCRPGWRKAS